MERKPMEQEKTVTDSQSSSTEQPDASQGRNAEEDPLARKPWWKRYGGDLAWILGIVILWQTGGIAWLQAQVLRLTAAAPKVEMPASAESTSTTVALPDAAWNWRLRRLDGPLEDQFFALAELRGRPLFVNQWATWCGPCRAELPSIQRLHAAYGEDLAMLLISNESPEVLQSWLAKNGYEGLPVYRAASAAPPPFQVRSIPASWLIDQEGRIVAQHSGAARWDAAAVRGAVELMLSKE